VVLAGGGTGGHVYPGLAVADALTEIRRGGGRDELLYIGIRGRVDARIVPEHGMPFRAIAAGPLRVSSPLAFVRNGAKLALGIAQSLWILVRFRPDVVFATGGYASVPVGVAARLLRKPLIVFLPDVTPGWAVRLLARLATRMATTSEAGLEHLPRANTRVVGYPVRNEFRSLDREGARERLHADRAEKVVVVTGASLGARAINQAVVAALPALLERCRVVHITGAADEAWVRSEREKLTPDKQARYDVHGYLDDMPAGLLAADLVVSRAGASTLGELPAAGVPSILVPGEYEGWSQAPNAEYLQSQGAAVMLHNEELDRLAATVMELLDDEPRLKRMRDSARALARPNAARDIAQMLVEAAA
jgi:UDP-N-acetylglucosamine--N-acetylmuramyl-(pentapeptide) pyrophosphoryl-undecaprenol N-acetylglucosamine transferase